jgi:RNA polymerase sigma factor (sigma-70 family)
VEPAAPLASDGLSIYLEQATEVPLLTRRDEVELARELARSRRALRRLNQRRNSARPKRGRTRADAFRRHKEARRLERSIEQTRDRLVLANLRLVVFVAKKFTSNGLPLVDLVQEGNIGLMKAVDRFDPERGHRFSTYAYQWIKQGIERAISNQARTVRVPVHVQDKLRSIRRATERLRVELQRQPTTDEIARELGYTQATVEYVLHKGRATQPLEDPQRNLDHLRHEPDPRAVSPFEQAVGHQRRRGVEEVLRALTSREREVIRLRYGLGCDARSTLSAVGEMLDLSRERVRQIEQQALEKIRAERVSGRLAGLAAKG